MVTMSHEDVTLRFASASDDLRLQTLAELDCARVPSGPVLIAEVDGRLRAALPLDGSDPIADPFQRAAGIVQLLWVRAAQLRDEATSGPTTLSALERGSSDLRSPEPFAALRRFARAG